MIIIGYQGIGKSTLAGRDISYIDLESGNFWVDGTRADDWYKPYCNIAEHLSQQGYAVFTSCHAVVRERLKDSSETVVVIYPSIDIKDQWMERLWTRYQRTGLDKDYKAYMNAKNLYDESIRDLDSCGVPNKIVLRGIDYDLDSIIEEFERGLRAE